jgi:hypothetical protein
MMNGSSNQPNSDPPNVHIPENKKVLSYLKEMHPFHEIIVPFSAKKVSQEITPADFIGRFAAMSGLPTNSKYVVYGLEALVHPETGVIFGFITGTNVIYRFPDHLLDEARRDNLNNFRVVREIGGNGMDGLEDNWVSSPSITEQVVRKCFEYYGSVAPEPKELRLNSGLNINMPSTHEFEEQERSRRWRPLGAIAVVCVLCVLLLYAVNYVIRLF